MTCNGDCALLNFKQCICEPYDEAAARRRFLLEDPPIFRHNAELAAITAGQVEQARREDVA